MPLTDVARFLSEFLKGDDIQYVVIGGLAVSVRGTPRATRDIDIVLLVSQEDTDSLLERIVAAGGEIPNPHRLVEKLKVGSPAKVMWKGGYSYDLRLAAYSIDLDAIKWATKVEIVPGVYMKVCPPEQLVVYKLARFSHRDRSDIEEVVKANPRLDWKLVEDTAKILAKEAKRPEILVNLEKTKEELL
jgi:predicted nucleotidyltransferase